MSTSTVVGQVVAGNPSDSNPAVNLAQVLCDENGEVIRLSTLRNAEPDLDSSEFKHDDFPERHTRPARLAVAFSGGGIRSAAVNLGVIQALAKAGILRQVHHMSAISGGGYILGWLTSWIRRSGFDDVERQLQSGAGTNGGNSGNSRFMSEVLRRLKSLGETFCKAQPRSAASVQQRSSDRTYYRYLEPDPIRYLRQYTSYLTPRVGLGSGDTLAMVSIYLRNLLLNQTMMICLLAGIVATTHLLAPWVFWKLRLPKGALVGFALLAAAVAALAGVLVGKSLDRLSHNQQPKKEWTKAGLYAARLTVLVAVCLWIVLPSALADGFKLALLIACGSVAITYLAGWICDSCIQVRRTCMR